MKKTLIIALLLVSLLLSACTIPPQAPCERLSYNNEHALNVILFQDGFNETTFRNLSTYVQTTILSKEPFTSKPFLNFYLVKNNDANICVEGIPEEVIGGYAPDPLAPLECNSTRVKELVNTCNIPRGKIIILTNDTVAPQTSLSFDESGVMFLDMKNQPPEIIQHEFAHFFGLVDERAKLYSYALGPGREPAPNCVETQEEAEKAWRSIYPANHTFPQGCAGNPAWYKPEYPTLLSEFPDPSWEYGAFNTHYLTSVLECCYGPEKLEGCEGFFETYPTWDGCRA